MSRAESCDMCGADINDEAVRAELSFGEGAMCPTPMTMHKACYDKASELWQPDPDSTCVYDPLFPETGQWTPAAGI